MQVFCFFVTHSNGILENCSNGILENAIDIKSWFNTITTNNPDFIENKCKKRDMKQNRCKIGLPDQDNWCYPCQTVSKPRYQPPT